MLWIYLNAFSHLCICWLLYILGIEGTGPIFCRTWSGFGLFGEKIALEMEDESYDSLWKYYQPVNSKLSRNWLGSILTGLWCGLALLNAAGSGISCVIWALIYSTLSPKTHGFQSLYWLLWTQKKPSLEMFCLRATPSNSRLSCWKALYVKMSTIHESSSIYFLIAHIKQRFMRLHCYTIGTLADKILQCGD